MIIPGIQLHSAASAQACAFILFWAIGLHAIDGHPCSDVMLPVEPVHGQVVSARTLDFSLVDQSLVTAVTLQAFERNRGWRSDWKGLGNGKQWRNTYGFVGMHALGQISRFIQGRVFNLDGLNEAGLSAAFLWLEQARYPQGIPSDADRSVSMVDTVNYILGMFRTVDEVVSALTNPTDRRYIEIFGLPLVQDLVPLHLVVHDATGRSLIVEWLAGSQHLYRGENVDSIGVLTNDPPYLEQVKNLRDHYSDVTPDNALLGIPGDASFQSRFVRLAKLREFAHLKRGDEPLDIVQVAAHLINNVDVVYGTNREAVTKHLRIDDYTGPTLIRDHAKGILYFKGHNNQGYRKIELAAVDFTKPHAKGILADPMPTDAIYGSYQFAQDVTPLLNDAELDWDGTFHGNQMLNIGVPTFRYGSRLRIPRSLFIHAQTRDGRLFQWNGRRWVNGLPYGRQLVRADVGSDTSGNVQVPLHDLPLSEEERIGTRIFAGAGASAGEILVNRRMKQVHVIDGAEP